MAVRTKFRTSSASLYSYRFGGAFAPRSATASAIFSGGGPPSQSAGLGGGGVSNQAPQRPAGAPAGATYFGSDATGRTVAWQYPDGTTHFFVDGQEAATARAPAQRTTGPSIEAITRSGGKFTLNDPTTGMAYYTMPNGQVMAFNPDGSYFGSSAPPPAGAGAPPAGGAAPAAGAPADTTTTPADTTTAPAGTTTPSDTTTAPSTTAAGGTAPITGLPATSTEGGLTYEDWLAQQQAAAAAAPPVAPTVNDVAPSFNNTGAGAAPGPVDYSPLAQPITPVAPAPTAPMPQIFRPVNDVAPTDTGTATYTPPNYTPPTLNNYLDPSLVDSMTAATTPPPDPYLPPSPPPDAQAGLLLVA